MATSVGVQLMGRTDHGLHVGASADPVLVPAETAAEAVAFNALRRWVLLNEATSSRATGARCYPR